MSNKTNYRFGTTRSGETAHLVTDAGPVCGTRATLTDRGAATPALRSSLLAHYTSGDLTRVAGKGRTAGFRWPCLNCEAKVRGVKVASLVALALENREPV